MPSERFRAVNAADSRVSSRELAPTLGCQVRQSLSYGCDLPVGAVRAFGLKILRSTASAIAR
jgi:hypothetical protein